MSQTLTALRHHPSVVASEDYVQHHPLVFVGYSVALVVVYLVVIAPLVARVTRSGFSDNLLYTGPGGALRADLGSCMSHRDTGCGSAEPFNPLRTAAHALQGRSGFANAPTYTGPSRLSQRSRFVNGREPDAVMALDQEGADAMAQEIQNIHGADDDGAAQIMQAHSKISADEAARQAAASTSTFASKHGAEAQLESLLRH